MNKRRLAAIARWLEAGAPEKKHVIGFNMREGMVYQEKKETAEETLKCGTTCCIAGAAVCFFNNPVEVIQKQMNFDPSLYRAMWVNVEAEGMKVLDLSESVAKKLFYVTRHNMTPAWAARCIRKLIKTGEVDWQGTEEEAS